MMICPDDGEAVAPPEIVHPSCRELFRYWERLRGERSAPSRDQIDLRAMAAILPWVGILERDGARRSYRWRVAGTGITSLWGRSLAGRELTVGWPDFERRTVVWALDAVTVRLQPFVARLNVMGADNGPVGIELLALPVEARAPGAIQVLCALLPFRDPVSISRSAFAGIELSNLRAIWVEPLPGDALARQARLGGPCRLRVIAGGRAG